MCSWTTGNRTLAWAALGWAGRFRQAPGRQAPGGQASGLICVCGIRAAAAWTCVQRQAGRLVAAPLVAAPGVAGGCGGQALGCWYAEASRRLGWAAGVSDGSE